MKGIAYIVTGIVGWIQFLWAPLYIGVSEKNVYLWAVCANCRAAVWVFSTISIVLGILYIILAHYKPDDYLEATSKGYIFYLGVNILMDVLTIF